jgi:hypothetical protein
MVECLRRVAGFSGRTLWVLAAWADATFLAGLLGPWMAGSGMTFALNNRQTTHRWPGNNPGSSGVLS